MSKYDHTGSSGGFKNPEDARAHANETAWKAVCAKLGQPEAMHVRAGGTAEQCHDARKAIRRAINALTISTANRDATPEELSAYDHAAHIVARLDGIIDSAEQNATGPTTWRDSTGRALKQMRNQADFDAHYRSGRRGNADDDVTIGDFFRGVANMPTTPAVRNALSEGTNSAGGFTLPSVVMPGILGALVPNSSLLQAGMPVIPLEQGAKSYTTAIVSGIPTAAWRLEAGAVTESDPVFSGVVAAPQSLSFFFRLSRELLADSANLDAALLAAIGQAMAKELDRAGLRGTGTAPQPRGILNTSGIQAVTNGANGTALAGYANLLSAVQALLTADAPMPNACIMHPRSLVKLAGLLDTTNQPLRRPPMLDAMSMLTTSQIPINLTVGTSSDCSEAYLGDFSKIAMMLRESLSVQLLHELYAGTGQVAFMCHCRADFAVMYPAAFAVVTGIRA